MVNNIELDQKYFKNENILFEIMNTKLKILKVVRYISHSQFVIWNKKFIVNLDILSVRTPKIIYEKNIKIFLCDYALTFF